MLHHPAALSAQSELNRPGSAPPKEQAEPGPLRMLAQATQAATLQERLGLSLEPRLTSSFTTSVPPLQSFNSEQQGNLGTNDSSYISYWHANKNLNPRLPSPWLDGTDEMDASGLRLGSLKESLRDVMEQVSGLNSPTQLQEQHSLNGKLRLASSSTALGSNSAPLAELTGRHHSFTAGNNIWGTRPTAMQLGLDKQQQSDLLMQVSGLNSPTDQQALNNGKIRLAASSAALGSNSGSPLGELAARHHSFTSGHDIWSRSAGLGLGEKQQPSVQQPQQPQGNMLLQDPARLSLLSNSFPSSRHRAAAPSKLRIGSTATDTLAYAQDSAGSPAAAHGVSEGLPALSPSLAAAATEAEADAGAGLPQGSAGNTADPASALLRDAAAAAAAAAQQQQQPEAEQEQLKAAMYLQAMAASVYPGYGDPMGPGNPFTPPPPQPGGYPLHMPGYGGAGHAFPGLDAAAAAAAGMMALPPGHLDPAMAASMGLPGVRPGQVPMPFPGLPFPAVSPAEYAAYYQRCMENQALMAAAAMGMPVPNMPLMPGMLLPDTSPFGSMPLGGAAGGSHLGPGIGLDARGRAAGAEGYLHHHGHLGMDEPLSARAVERLAGAGHNSRRNSRRDDGAPGARNSSVVLEEFKANKTRKYELSDIQGHMYEFALDQHGSRFIQQKLETATEEELGAVLTEVLPRIMHLMTDVFGNYVVQKLLEHGSPSQRMQLSDTLKGQVLALSLQMYGCRVVQKAIEVLPVDAQCALVAELDGNVMRCVRDQNGNHVIQKVVECVPTPRITALLDNFMGCVVQLSSHPFGCRIMQRILEHCTDADRRGNVMRDILSNAHQLSQDQYGNYVIQHVLEHGSGPDRATVAASLTPHVVALSTHKFASNVVEKALVHCAFPERDALIRVILGPMPGTKEPTEETVQSPQAGGSGASIAGSATSEKNTEGAEAGPEEGSGGGAAAAEDALQTMMHDQYGNYVVQKVLEVCDDAQREYLLSRVRAQLHLLKKYTYGKHIVARVEKLLLSGTKIQTHLRARPLPNDTQSLSTVAPKTAPGTSGGGAETGTNSSPRDAKCDVSIAGSTQPTTPAGGTGNSTPAHHCEPDTGATNPPYPAVPAPMVPSPQRASDSASPPPAL